MEIPPPSGFHVPGGAPTEIRRRHDLFIGLREIHVVSPDAFDVLMYMSCPTGHWRTNTRHHTASMVELMKATLRHCGREGDMVVRLEGTTWRDSVML
jgi:hypothetical protein